MTDLFKIYLDEAYNVGFYVDKWILISGIILAIIIVLWKLYSKNKTSEWEIDEARLGIGRNSLKLKPNRDDKQIAYKVWIELNTRKIGLTIDEHNDVLIEVYNSWYEFFKITRELLKDIPAHKLQREDTKKLVKLTMDILNYELRPHLTTWQAKYRKWYDHSLTEDTDGKSPQDIQKSYPHFEELISDMKNVNQSLIYYKVKLAEMVGVKHEDI
jgi:hypothetical protein